MARKKDYGADGKMRPDEFEVFVDELIQDMKAKLPEAAKKFVTESGRGAMCLHFQDAEKADDRRAGVGYITPDRLPDHQYLKQLIVEYDPENELVIWATSGPVHVIRHLKFAELAGGAET